MEKPLNTSFSTQVPHLQIYLDSSSLGEFKICPRKYYYSIIKGYQPFYESIHLIFGTILHLSVEHYWKCRLALAMDHEEALRYVVRMVMDKTWDKNLARPWQSENKAKNRYTLLRTIVWYLDKFRNDPIQTIFIANKPAVELPFNFHSGYESQLTGEHFIICGRLDRLGLLNGQQYVVDIKSTGRRLSEDWIKGFTPDNQFTIYCIASKEVYKTETVGLIVDGCQVLQTNTDFYRYYVERNDFQINEWQRDLGYHLNNLDNCARTDTWPQNDKACNLYGGCPFRGVCSQRSESGREAVLNTEYRSRVWDPLANRLDY